MLYYNTDFGHIKSAKEVEKGDVIQVTFSNDTTIDFYVERIKGSYLELSEYEIIKARYTGNSF
jgi:hypothetical protein